MFVYRIIQTSPPPEVVIIEQSNVAYRWIRDAEIHAVAQVDDSVPFGTRLTWTKQGKRYRAHTENYRFELIEAIEVEGSGPLIVDAI